MQQAEKLDLDEEIKLLEKTVMRKELSTSTDRIKRTLKPTPKATFLTIVSDFTWGHWRGGYCQRIIRINSCTAEPCHDIFCCHGLIPWWRKNFPKIDFIERSPWMHGIVSAKVLLPVLFELCERHTIEGLQHMRCVRGYGKHFYAICPHGLIERQIIQVRFVPVDYK